MPVQIYIVDEKDNALATFHMLNKFADRVEFQAFLNLKKELHKVNTEEVSTILDAVLDKLRRFGIEPERPKYWFAATFQGFAYDLNELVHQCHAHPGCTVLVDDVVDDPKGNDLLVQLRTQSKEVRFENSKTDLCEYHRQKEKEKEKSRSRSRSRSPPKLKSKAKDKPRRKSRSRSPKRHHSSH